MTNQLNNQIEIIEEKIKETSGLIETIKNDSSQTDLLELAKEDLINLQNQKSHIKQAINSMDGNFTKSMQVSKKDHHNNCIIEIRAGTGGNEAGLFANDLYIMYLRFAEKNNWKVHQLSKQAGEIGNIKEVVFEITGKKNKYLTPFTLLKNESGVHRVQRIPATESSGRIHTSTATVAVLPVVDDISIGIRKEDLQIDTYRSSGAGGQHVNKTDSAIRITHKATGLVVQCQDERSQHKNKARAMSMLNSKLYELMQQQQKDSIDDLRSNQVGTGARSEKIKTYNFPQDRITDHRIKKSWHNMEKVLNGEIEEILITTNKILSQQKET